MSIRTGRSGARTPVFQVETMEALIERRVGSYAVIAGLLGSVLVGVEPDDPSCS